MDGKHRKLDTLLTLGGVNLPALRRRRIECRHEWSDGCAAAVQAPYAAADEDLAARFLAEAARDPAAEARIDARATA